MNCGRCMDNLRVDGQGPECDECRYKDISGPNLKALLIYNLACPWEDFSPKGIEMAFEYFGIRKSEQRKYHKKAITIYRLIKDHYAPKE